MKIIAAYKSKNAKNDAGLNILVWPDSALVKSGKPVFIEENEKYFLVPGIGAKIHSVGKSIKFKFATRYFNEICPLIMIMKDSVARCITDESDPLACDIVSDYSIIYGDSLCMEEFDESNSLNMEISISPFDGQQNFSSKTEIKLPVGLLEDTLYNAIVAASLQNTIKTGDTVAVLFQEILPATSESILKVDLGNRLLIQNKLK